MIVRHGDFFVPDFSVRRICMDKKIFNAELRYYTVIRLAKKMLDMEQEHISELKPFL